MPFLMVNLFCIDICFLFICADILYCQYKFCEILFFTTQFIMENIYKIYFSFPKFSVPNKKSVGKCVIMLFFRHISFFIYIKNIETQKYLLYN